MFDPFVVHYPFAVLDDRRFDPGQEPHLTELPVAVKNVLFRQMLSSSHLERIIYSQIAMVAEDTKIEIVKFAEIIVRLRVVRGQNVRPIQLDQTIGGGLGQIGTIAGVYFQDVVMAVVTDNAYIGNRMTAVGRDVLIFEAKVHAPIYTALIQTQAPEFRVEM